MLGMTVHEVSERYHTVAGRYVGASHGMMKRGQGVSPESVFFELLTAHLALFVFTLLSARTTDWSQTQDY
jgi:hypothetical protein